MATVRKRGERWFAEVRKKGVSRRGTFRTKSQARKWALSVEDAIDDGIGTEQHTLHEAFDRYAREVSSTKPGERWERVRLARFKRDMPNKPLESLQPADLAAWRDRRLQSVMGSSVRREMTLLSSVLNIAIKEWGWIDKSPLQHVRKPANPPSREQIITDEQVARLFEVGGYQRGMQCRVNIHLTCAALDLALETAMRAGEIVGLTGDCLHLDERYVNLPMTKNGTARKVPLSQGAVRILSSLDPDRPFPISSDTLSTVFRRLKNEAGYRGEFTFHDSRATAITRLASKLSIHDLARMTGHRDMRMLQRYYRATASEIASLLD